MCLNCPCLCGIFASESFVIVTAMDRMEEILEIVREIREDVSFMKRHRNMLCGMPILEVGEVCDLLKMSDR